jgi:hypothetical protein
LKHGILFPTKGRVYMRRFQQAFSRASVRHAFMFSTALAAVLVGVGAAGAATGPVATIDSQPASVSSSTDATFGFSASDESATFACSLDWADPAPCSSPVTYGPLDDGVHRFQVQAVDALGTAGPAAETTWSIDTVPAPTVTATTLAGASDVSVLATPSATFSRPIDPMTVDPASFTLAPTGGLPVAASVEYDSLSNTATLVPSAPLASSTTYRAQLTTAVEAQGDLTPLASDVTWAFTTRAAPEIKKTSIAPNATGVSPFMHLELTFTRAMDPASFTTASLSLWRPDGTQVPATPYAEDSNTAELTTILPLNYSTTYTIRVSGVRAANGVPIVPVSWRFTVTSEMVSTRINVGSATAYRASDGAVWAPDQFFRSGVAETFAGRAITGTSDPALFRDHRRATSTIAPWIYNIPVPNGTYRVKLSFVELTKWARGQRIFSIDVYDTPGAYPDVYNLDIYREVGANAADVKSFDVTIADSTLTLRSIAYIDLPELAAIEIVPKS